MKYKLKYLHYAKLGQHKGVIDFRIDRVAGEYAYDWFNVKDVSQEDKEWFCQRGIAPYKLHCFEDLLPLIDILSFHCPLTPENKDILNVDAIAKMKAGAVVVNTARGKLINEQALYNALKSGKLHMAALDVHYEEPIRQENLLKTLDNVILTPHIGGLSYEAFHRMMVEAIENICLFENGYIDKIENKYIFKHK